MEDKSLIQIFFECLVGIILMIPLNKINSDGTVWIVIMRLLYSFGIMLAMTKIMSILFRMISCIFRMIMMLHQKSYGILCFIFIGSGVVLWNLYPSYFTKGYFVAEIIAYVLFSFWFLLDVNTTKCFWYIMFLYAILNSEVEEHKECVATYKNNMNSISNRKNGLVKELEVYFPKRFFSDPLKELKKDINLSSIDRYLQKVPSFHGEYKGIGGFLTGQICINEFENAIEHYLGNLDDDEQWMDSEQQVYDGYISEMEKMVDTIQKSEKRVETLDKLRIDSREYQEILEKDIADAGNNRKSIKQFWKMNKKIIKSRRKNYGR